MLGQPIFNYDDRVMFTIDGDVVVGTIAIIDAWGTFLDRNRVYYDVLTEDQQKLYKHISEESLEIAK